MPGAQEILRSFNNAAVGSHSTTEDQGPEFSSPQQQQQELREQHWSEEEVGPSQNTPEETVSEDCVDSHADALICAPPAPCNLKRDAVADSPVSPEAETLSTSSSQVPAARQVRAGSASCLVASEFKTASCDLESEPLQDRSRSGITNRTSGTPGESSKRISDERRERTVSSDKEQRSQETLQQRPQVTGGKRKSR